MDAADGAGEHGAPQLIHVFDIVEEREVPAVATPRTPLVLESLYGLILAAGGAGLYRAWVTRPFLTESSLVAAYALGIIGGATFGFLAAFVMRHLVLTSVTALVAILAGHTWALRVTTDVSTPYSAAMLAAAQEMRVYHLVLVGAILVAWWVGRVLLGARHRVPADNPGGAS